MTITARHCCDCTHVRMKKDGPHCYNPKSNDIGKKIQWDVNELGCVWWYPKH